MKRYLKLYRAFFVNCLIREMAFRSHFFLSNLISFLWAAVFIFTYLFIYRYTDSVNGWSAEQILLLTSIYFLSYRIFDSFCEINFGEFVELVNTGRLDLYLTKPVGAQFLVSLRRFSFTSVFSNLAMVVMAAYLIRQYFWPVPPLNWLIFVAVFFSGIVITYSLWFITLLPVFWWGRADNLSFLFRPLHQITRIPIDLTGRYLRPLLTFIVPLAFVATFPVKALTGSLSPFLALYGPAAAGFLLWLSHRLWRFALRRYSSASS